MLHDLKTIQRRATTAQIAHVSMPRRLARPSAWHMGFLGLLALLCIAPQASASETPLYPFDPRTTKYCVWWIDIDGPWTCQDVNTIFGLSTDDFISWNPSLAKPCNTLPTNTSFCVSSLESLHTPFPVVTTTTTSPPPRPTTTNGIATPSPIQPGMVSNCAAFYLTQPGDTCAGIASASGVALADFLAWNPRVGGSACGGLWANAYVCVRVVGMAGPSPTGPGNGVVTPVPVQPGVSGSCRLFYFVQPGDSCVAIAGVYGIVVGDFERWNPAVGRDCLGLWAGTWCCVGVL
ncbi:hypothetical protein B0H67DRAFT_543028 [Lasiosphaeris hirsuta]|uniref:LysM domain-containing protein n=1 Tax=Lasiosphaeris hirsuta TaxID=260670 RepID=A0AA40A1Y5_9PEZI|nr:hypothetical protein B0H67DRAFT_543028 [Lasiosphaeris hirsuta]